MVAPAVSMRVLKATAEEEVGVEWADRFIAVANAIEVSLATQVGSLYRS